MKLKLMDPTVRGNIHPVWFKSKHEPTPLDSLSRGETEGILVGHKLTRTNNWGRNFRYDQAIHLELILLI